jgi:hypothetical protein
MLSFSAKHMKVGDKVLIEDGPHEGCKATLCLKIPIDTPFCGFKVQPWLIVIEPNDNYIDSLADNDDYRTAQVYGEHMLTLI